MTDWITNVFEGCGETREVEDDSTFKKIVLVPTASKEKS